MKPRRWTQAAIECWQRGCICEGCYYKTFFDNSESNAKCQMKRAVIESVRFLGIPPNKKEKTIIP